MKVSVVVVSHNIGKLMGQFFTALSQSVKNMDAEIILVDHNYDEATLKSISEQFASIKAVNSPDSKGTSQSVNQGIAMAKGEYVLLISPDVITKFDAIEKAVQFMDSHTTAGGASVRMLDTAGNYMPQSKKVLPQSWVALFKLTGLLKQFPKSRLTENFVPQHNDEFDTAETDILSEKFMLLRRSVLNNIGLLDERFATFGANIDLSHRIRLAGFKNYYFPKTYIINLQSNSSAKLSWGNMKNLYGAMFIFAVKYIFKLPAINVKPLQDLYPAYELKG